MLAAVAAATSPMAKRVNIFFDKHFRMCPLHFPYAALHILRIYTKYITIVGDTSYFGSAYFISAAFKREIATLLPRAACCMPLPSFTC